MRLPEIRAELRKIQRWHQYVSDRLGVLIAEIERRPQVKRGPRRSNPMTAQRKEQAREMYLNGNMTQHEVAQALGVNAGRVSEAVRGKRT